MSKCSIGVIGCGVMGSNLALNLGRHGYTVALHDADYGKVKSVLTTATADHRLVGVEELGALPALLDVPRRILMMLPAGAGVDRCIEALLPLGQPGDLLIDGGNSHFADTQRRTRQVEERGWLYVGMGISGGAAGALQGPALMPGGSPAAWPLIGPMCEQIAARAPDGAPCCAWIGPGGAGHFVKMVHNGIEYADMQAIAEVYHVLRDALGLSADEMSRLLDEWNRGELASYLVEITRDVLAQRDADGATLVDQILDVAGAKGTGLWTVQAGLELNQPLTLVATAVAARVLSASREARLAASHALTGIISPEPPDSRRCVTDLRAALYASRIVSYAQGFSLLDAASRAHGWNLDLARIAGIWRAGCILRGAILGPIRNALAARPAPDSLLLAPVFRAALESAQPGWRRSVACAVHAGIPVPALAAALAFYDSYRCARLPANLLQAQRDYFGAHGFERIDRPRGEIHHGDWAARPPTA